MFLIEKHIHCSINKNGFALSQPLTAWMPDKFDRNEFKQLCWPARVNFMEEVHNRAYREVSTACWCGQTSYPLPRCKKKPR
jgi:hypothetical protein